MYVCMYVCMYVFRHFEVYMSKLLVFKMCICIIITDLQFQGKNITHII